MPKGAHHQQIGLTLDDACLECVADAATLGKDLIENHLHAVSSEVFGHSTSERARLKCFSSTIVTT
jgi:hypothetical protein